MAAAAKGDPTATIEATRVNTSVRGPADSPAIEGYEIGAELGRGGMGIVYEAYDVQLRRRVALKILPETREASAGRLQRFRNEAHAAAMLQHENIVPVFHVGESADVCYYTMPLIDGQTLAQIIRTAQLLRLQKQNASTLGNELKSTAGGTDPAQRSATAHTVQSGVLSEFLHEVAVDKSVRSGRRIAQIVARTGVQVARALDYAHQAGVVHRDIKPSNLLCDASGKVWVTDFGLARMKDAEPLTRTGDVIGTLHYMSPELATTDHGLVDHRSDIYSLGATLYELATLERSVRGRTAKEILRELNFGRPVPIREVDPSLPRDLEIIISKCMERNPADRYQSAAELAEDFERLLRGEQPRARPLTWTARFRNWVILRPAVALGIAAALFVTTLFGATLAAVFNSGMQTERSLRLQAEGSRLLAQASLESSEDPPLATALALAGARLAPGSDADRALLESMDDNRLVGVLAAGTLPQHVGAYSPMGDRLLLYDASSNSASSTRVTMLDVATQSVIANWEWDFAVDRMEFDPTGDWVAVSARRSVPAQRSASTSGQPTLLVWDTRREVVRFELPGYRLPAGGDVFADHAQRWLLAWDESETLCLVDREGRIVQRLLQDSPVLAAAVSRTGRWIAMLDHHGQVVVADESATPIGTWQLHSPSTAATLTFAAGDRLLLVQQAMPSTVWLVDLQRPEQLPRLWENVEGKVSSDGQRMYLKSWGINQTKFEVRALPANRRLGTWVVDATVNDFGLIDQESIVAVPVYSRVALLDADDLGLIGWCKGHADSIEILVTHPHSSRFLTEDRDGNRYLWTSQSDRQRRHIATGSASLGALVLDISADGKRALVSQQHGYATQVYSRSNEQRIATIEGMLQRVGADGKLWLWNAGRLIVWNARGTQKLHEVSIPGARTARMEIVSGLDGALLYVDLSALYFSRPGGMLERLDNERQGMQQYALAAASPRLAIRYRDGSIIVRDLNGAEQWEVELPVFHVSICRLSPDGQRLYLLSGNQLITWGIDTQEQLSAMELPGGLIREAIPMPSDRILLVRAAAGNEESVLLELWDLVDRRMLRQVPLGRNYVQEVAAVAGRAAFGADRSFVVVDAVNDVLLTRTETGKVLPSFKNGQLYYVVLADKHRDSEPADDQTSAPRSSSSPPGSSVYRWDFDTQEPEQIAELEASPRSFTFWIGEEVFALTADAAQVVEVDLEHRASSRPLLADGQFVSFARYVESGDREEIAVQADRGDLDIYQEGGRHVARIATPGDRRRSWASSDDGTLVAIAMEDRVACYHLPSRRRIEELVFDGAHIKQIRMAPAGTHLLIVAATAEATRLLVHDFRARQTGELQLGARVVLDSAWRGDGKRSVVLHRNQNRQARGARDADDRLTVVGVTGDRLAEFPVAVSATQARWVGQRDWIAILTTSGQIQLIEATSGKQLRWISQRVPIFGLGRRPIGDDLLVGFGANHCFVWNMLTGDSVVAMSGTNLTRNTVENRLDQWELTSAHCDWWCIPNDDGFQLVPKNVLRYAEEHVPRILTQEEVQRYRVPRSAVRP
ncbi:MAG: hypothetical protein KatS3mg111_1341 [Pirellulaceae bacterium]|nr:MAG: hypothetical protein KatS3mg111_1341 [Pirellulaceae bacterium]